MKSTEQTAELQPKQGFFRREMSEWFGNIVGDLWGGIITTFALLPEVIGFMIVVGIPPYMGLFTCVCLTILTSFIGGRPGMITAGAGATALILVSVIEPYFATHPEYIFATVILAGIIQLILGICRVGSLVKFLPDCVMKGFVNGFAIVILVSQLKLCVEPVSQNIENYILIGIGILLIVGFGQLKKLLPFLRKIPDSLAPLVIVTAYVLIFNRNIVNNVVNIGDISGSMDNVKASFQYVGNVFVNFGNIFTGECLGAIILPAFYIAAVGLIESMLTGRMVSEETKTYGNMNREARAQGIGNMVCGILGCMPGCGMIAMTVTNLKSGGKGRLSQLVAGVLMAGLLLFTSLVYPIIGVIPLAAVCAVMFVVCYHTMNWDTIIHFYRKPVIETVVMVLSAILIIATHNLAIGVGAGIALYAIIYLLGRFTPPAAQIAISLAFLGGAIGVGISGFFGFNWGFAIAMFAAAVAVGLSSITMTKTEGAMKSIALGIMVASIGVGVAAVVACATIGFPEMTPWHEIIAAATPKA